MAYDDRPADREEGARIRGRVEWFRRRTAIGAGHAGDLQAREQLATALDRAERELADPRRVVAGIAEGPQGLVAYRRAREDLGPGPLLLDPAGRAVPVALGPDRDSQPGAIGPVVRLEDRLPADWGLLVIPLDPGEHRSFDLTTARAIRYDGNPHVVEASRFYATDGLLVARVVERGEYQAAALPSHPALRTAVGLLALTAPRLAAASGSEPATTGLIDAVTSLLLETIAEAPDDPLALGLRERLRGDALARLAFLRSLIASPMLLLDHAATLAAARWATEGPFGRDGFWGIGRVSQIDVDPRDGDIVVAATAGGGVWRTDDGGAHWRPLMDGERSLTMGAVALAPSRPECIYAASGEDAGGRNPAWPGPGLYRSPDGGSTWDPVRDLPSTRFSAIAVDPTDPDTLYVAGNRGLHKSIDGGQTWVAGPEPATLFPGQITDVVIAHDEPARLYVARSEDGVYRTRTGGEGASGRPAFERLDVGALAPGSGVGWVKLAIGRRGAHGSRFLAAKLGERGERVFVSTDGGDRWTERPAADEVFIASWCSMIAVHPDEEWRLYAGGERLQLTDAEGQWRRPTTSLHADQQDIAVDLANPDRLYLANDGGVYVSRDRGASWRPAWGGLAIGQVYSADLGEAEPSVLGCATHDNGIYYRPRGRDWTQLGNQSDGDGTRLRIDPQRGLSFYAASDRGPVTRSHDGGETPLREIPTQPLGSYPWVPMIAVDSGAVTTPESEREVLFADKQRIFVSRDAGHGSARIDGFVADGEISALAHVAGPTRLLYVGTTTGRIYRLRSSDGASWTREELPGRFETALDLGDGQVSSIEVEPGDPDRAWVAFAGAGVSFTNRPEAPLPSERSRVFKRRHDGTAWTWVPAGGAAPETSLPDVPVSAIAIDPVFGVTVHVGTDIGVFKSLDEGATWSALGENLPRAPVTDLRLSRGGRVLLAATMGRGVFSLSLAP
ncbi:MAG: hypothetical protein L0027_04215 [Candidatus Rokubacteria bacterium]|nr:hypothetical protein [Candidatus Rokubacteria bacterium]